MNPRSLVLALFLVGLAPPGFGQQPAEQPELKIYQLRYQPAQEAYHLLVDLLSPTGEIELNKATNTIQVRDQTRAIGAIDAFLKEFDHELQELSFDLYLLEATPSTGSGERLGALPDPLAKALESTLLERVVAETSFRLLGSIEIETREGEKVSYSVGTGYEVGFQVGTIVRGQQGKRVKLHGVEVLDRSSGMARVLLRTDMNPTVGRVLTLFVPGSSSHNAPGLVLALDFRPKQISPETGGDVGGY